MDDKLSHIEQRLKERAMQRLRDHVNKQTLGEIRYISGRMFAHFEVTREDLEGVREVDELLEIAVKKIIDGLADDFYKQELGQFIGRTDDLQKQLDELKDTIPTC
jgi:hypothetical protein